MPLERFFKKYPKYTTNGFYEDPVIEGIYKWLSLPESISTMLDSCDRGRPALEAVIEELEVVIKDLEQKFEQTKFSISSPTLEAQYINYNKQLIGAMVKEILWDFGYRQTKNMKLSNNVKSVLNSATHYEYDPQFETKQLAIEITIKILKEEIPFV